MNITRHPSPITLHVSRFTLHVSRLLSLLLLFWLLLRPHPLAAHNELRHSYPAAGQTLSQSPTEIRLTFSEPPANGGITLYDQQFRQIADVTLRPPGENPHELAAALPQLEDGTYTVQWLTLSADNHTVSGSFQFSVRHTPQSSLMNNLIVGVLAAAILAGLILFWQGITHKPHPGLNKPEKIYPQMSQMDTDF
ncbi:MAG: copper resistance protein CopC [Anaerolineae bacterium]|nr:copper resistance protein CopC [Anaerolineae bacterium]